MDFTHLKPIDSKSGEINVIVETPRGSRNKYGYDPELKLFMLKGVLPAGAFFPYDFGFIPQTKGEDGDPLDILVLMDEPSFPGCLVRSRLIGVLVAEQTERSGQTVRNDRYIAVAESARTYQEIKDLNSLDKTLLSEIEHFFVSYNSARGKQFKVIKRENRRESLEILDRAISHR